MTRLGFWSVGTILLVVAMVSNERHVVIADTPTRRYTNADLPTAKGSPEVSCPDNVRVVLATDQRCAERGLRKGCWQIVSHGDSVCYFGTR